MNQVHLSARSMQDSPMTFRRPDMPMGAMTVPSEYERRVADAALIAAARPALG